MGRGDREAAAIGEADRTGVAGERSHGIAGIGERVGSARTKELQALRGDGSALRYRTRRFEAQGAPSDVGDAYCIACRRLQICAAARGVGRHGRGSDVHGAGPARAADVARGGVQVQGSRRYGVRPRACERCRVQRHRLCSKADRPAHGHRGGCVGVGRVADRYAAGPGHATRDVNDFSRRQVERRRAGEGHRGAGGLRFQGQCPACLQRVVASVGRDSYRVGDDRYRTAGRADVDVALAEGRAGEGDSAGQLVGNGLRDRQCAVRGDDNVIARRGAAGGHGNAVMRAINVHRADFQRTGIGDGENTRIEYRARQRGGLDFDRIGEGADARACPQDDTAADRIRVAAEDIHRGAIGVGNGAIGEQVYGAKDIDASKLQATRVGLLEKKTLILIVGIRRVAIVAGDQDTGERESVTARVIYVPKGRVAAADVDVKLGRIDVKVVGAVAHPADITGGAQADFIRRHMGARGPAAVVVDRSGRSADPESIVAGFDEHVAPERIAVGIGMNFIDDNVACGIQANVSVIALHRR